MTAVEVGADAQPVQRDVVAGVDDRSDLDSGPTGRVGARPDAHGARKGPDAPQEPCSADAAGQNGDSHMPNLRDVTVTTG